MDMYVIMMTKKISKLKFSHCNLNETSNISSVGKIYVINKIKVSYSYNMDYLQFRYLSKVFFQNKRSLVTLHCHPFFKLKGKINNVIHLSWSLRRTRKSSLY